jgi:hypothetical protein
LKYDTEGAVNLYGRVKTCRRNGGMYSVKGEDAPWLWELEIQHGRSPQGKPVVLGKGRGGGGGYREFHHAHSFGGQAPSLDLTRLPAASTQAFQQARVTCVHSCFQISSG